MDVMNFLNVNISTTIRLISTNESNTADMSIFMMFYNVSRYNVSFTIYSVVLAIP